MAPKLSIVIPAYNEEKRLYTTLTTICTYFQNTAIAYELILVNDGSRDDTLKIMNDFVSVHPDCRVITYQPNHGKGYAVQQGVAAATGSCILFSDADLSTPITEYPRLQHILDRGYDIVIGSRASASSNVQIHQPWYREIMGKTFNLFIKLLIFQGFNDTQCGFKLFKADVARKLFAELTTRHFAFDVEIIYRAVKAGYKVKEEGVLWLNSKGSRVSPVRDSVRMFFDLLHLRFTRKI